MAIASKLRNRLKSKRVSAYMKAMRSGHKAKGAHKPPKTERHPQVAGRGKGPYGR